MEKPYHIWGQVLLSLTTHELNRVLSNNRKNTNGAIAGWLVDSCCGIQVENGCIRIAPHPDRRLGYARAEYDSPYGKIVSAWKYVDDSFTDEVEVPANMTAEIRLPDKDVLIVNSGVYHY